MLRGDPGGQFGSQLGTNRVTAPRLLSFLTAEKVGIVVSVSGGSHYSNRSAADCVGAKRNGSGCSWGATGGGFGGGWWTYLYYFHQCLSMPPQIAVAAESYNRMVRMIRAGEKVKMEVDLEVKYHDEDVMAYNTIAEIPGTDLKDELVMLGGHMDSWHSGTGATDNGAKVAACMEAAHYPGGGFASPPHGSRRSLDRRGARVGRLWCLASPNISAPMAGAGRRRGTRSGRGWTQEEAADRRRECRDQQCRRMRRRQRPPTLRSGAGSRLGPNTTNSPPTSIWTTAAAEFAVYLWNKTKPSVPFSAAGWNRSTAWARKHSPFPAPVPPTTFPSTGLVCPDFNSCKTRWITSSTPTTPARMCLCRISGEDHETSLDHFGGFCL